VRDGKCPNLEVAREDDERYEGQLYAVPVATVEGFAAGDTIVVEVTNETKKENQ